MKVGILLNPSPKVRDFIQSRKSPKMELAYINSDMVDDYPFEDLGALICSKVPYESITALREPLLVQVPWSGVDHLDFDFFKSDSRLTLCNSHANSDAVAEHAWALLMDVAKKVAWNDRRLRKGDWSGRSTADGYSVRLRGKTLLLVGLGSVGTQLSRMGHAFGMRVVAVKRHPTTVPVGAEVQNVVGHTQLETVLPDADAVIVCAPLTKETKNLFGPFNLSRMKPGALFVSISRSGIIDPQALYTALKEEKLTGAALDNWPRERMSSTPGVHQDQPFHELNSIVLSPHRAFRIQESGFDQWEDVLENVNRVLEGKNPRNQVDLELGY